MRPHPAGGSGLENGRQAPSQAAANLMALLPVVSFAAQWYFSARAGTLPLMLRHWTVTAADWIFVPFNYLVIQTIDWKRGLSIFAAAAAALVANTWATAYWQANHLDLGHMITHSGVVLPAGWTHLVFASIETTLLVCLAFVRDPTRLRWHPADSAAAAYLVAMGICGRLIHGRFVLTDVAVSLGGLAVLVLARHRRGPAALTRALVARLGR